MAFEDLAELTEDIVTTVVPSGGRITRAFASDAISYIDYDPSTEELSVTFTRGGPYIYTGVPSSVVEGWLTADSAGRYYHAFIKAYA